MQPEKFISFKTSIKGIKPPEKLNNPFENTPPKLAQIAAKELQNYLLTQHDFFHDFGDASSRGGTSTGKMFGVLVVKTTNDELGYLAAFSGKLANTNLHKKFVPPVFDTLVEGEFYRLGEEELNTINKKIKNSMKCKDYTSLQKQLSDFREKAESNIVTARQAIKEGKKRRKALREQLSTSLTKEISDKLIKESLDEQYHFKRLKRESQAQEKKLKQQLTIFENQIEALKKERKTRSAALQQRLFDNYTFLNQATEKKSLLDIFKQTTLKVPPSGAGECAAPKLFQYAFKHNLTPISLGEFWWGESSKTAIRKHGHYYPSCKSKCEPILKHMLSRTNVDKQLSNIPTQNIERLDIVFEDDDLIIVNKPHGFLSVPGKVDAPSVYDIAKRLYPNISGPILTHRLDMSTSGLLVLAKNKGAHEHIQKQFLAKTVQKRYVAILDGEVDETNSLIELPLRVDLDNRPQQMVCYKHGKAAKTIVKVLSSENGYTRVHFHPITGRTHQLRVHASHPDGLNTAIKGDDLYGIKKDRLYLHAEHIQFRHPKTEKKLSFTIQADF